MKALSFAVLSALVFSGTFSHACLKRPGTVIRTACSPAKEDSKMAGGYSIKKFCTGRISGQDGDVVIVEELKTVRGKTSPQVTVWEIVGATRKGSVLRESGYVNEDGLFQEKMATSDVKGEVQIQLGPNGETVAVKGHLGGRKFTATNFSNIPQSKRRCG